MKIPLKERFRRALFAFFKEDILAIVKYSPPFTVERINKDIRLEELRTEIVLDERNYHQYNAPPASVQYEEALDRARKALFEESMKFIQIDERSVVDPRLYPHRAIVLRLYVGLPPNRKL